MSRPAPSTVSQAETARTVAANNIVNSGAMVIAALLLSVLTGVGVTIGFGSGFMSPFGRMEQPWYRREVSVILRELASNQVVWESHAVADGPWSDNAGVLPAMFSAAMQGFPAAPAGVRKVVIDVPAR